MGKYREALAQSFFFKFYLATTAELATVRSSPVEDALPCACALPPAPTVEAGAEEGGASFLSRPRKTTTGQQEYVKFD